MTTTRRATYEDLVGLPDDGDLHELVRGEIRRMPPPTEPHGAIEAALIEAVSRIALPRWVGPNARGGRRAPVWLGRSPAVRPASASGWPMMPTRSAVWTCST